MEIPQQQPQLCMVCLNNANITCTLCYGVHYCSPEHQMQHLPIHREVCSSSRETDFLPSTSSDLPGANFSSYLDQTWCQNNLPCAETNDDLALYQPLYQPGLPDHERQSIEDDLFSSLTSELFSSDNNLWDLINSCDNAQDLFNDTSFLDKEPETRTENHIPDKKVLNLMGGASLQTICDNVTQDLSQYGICVLDKFLGEPMGSLVLEEVIGLYRQGIFRKGELMGRPDRGDTVRSDVTTWVDGTEGGCGHIGTLMRVLDVVMTSCNKLQGGALAPYKLHRRTKAMIACYPGDGTHYKKHIDNPHQDGRCITCIYYLNKNWDIRKHGGMLRMFPSIMKDDIAEIEPVFDRMIFFWSDKRNPHEVLRAFRTRFAITVWYFDADERDRALMKSRARTDPTVQ